MPIRGIHPAQGEPIEITVQGGRIRSVMPSKDMTDLFVSPGWIDLQVNGFAGVDYNDPLSPADEIARSIEVQRSTGVTRFFPTVITGSHDDMAESLRNLARARQHLANGRSILGFHVEGPWISPLDGPRGAHPQEHVRSPSISEFKRLQAAADGGIRLVTLSPEHEGTPEVIEHMVSEGIVVSIGHTAATAPQIEAAVAAGATMSTHLGNGAHSNVPRHDNYIVHQLVDDRLYAGFIVDGIHLPPSFARLALRAKGQRLSVLVTDAVAPAHCAPGLFKLGEQEVELSPDHRVQLTSNGRLAGSALSMDRSIENVMRFEGYSAYDATRLATSNPAAAMGLSDRSGYLDLDQTADFTLFRVSDAGSVSVERTVISEC